MTFKKIKKYPKCYRR